MNFRQKTQIVFSSENLSNSELDFKQENKHKHQFNLNNNINSVEILQNSLAELNQNFSHKKRTLLIDSDSENPRVALIGHGKLLDYEYYTNLADSKGSIHLGVVTKILPGLQAVFIKYKNGKNGFLPFSEIDPVYLKKIDNIPFQNQKNNEIFFENEMPEKVFNQNDSRQNFNQIEDSEEYGVVYEESGDFAGIICINQIILVQITKEERGSKGSSLTSFISLNGRYCMYMPNKKNKNAISKNITNLIDKKRLDLIVKSLNLSENESIFILNNAIRSNAKEINEDYEILQKLWKKIKEDASQTSIVPRMIYFEENLIKNIFFNINMLNVKNIIIDGKTTYENAIEFAKTHMPSYLPIIKIHDIDFPIFKYYGVDSAVNKLFSNIISLKSGGYVVWNKTEALISIDVNSGKSKDEICIEETALKTNLEAISEIMMQIKLRKISGLIVIDLIGMRDPHHLKLLETTTKRLSNHDKAKIQIYLIEELSLLVLSRQRLGQSLIEAYGTKCQNCHGFGHILSNEMILKRLFDDLKTEIFENPISNFNIFVNRKFIDFIINNGKEKLLEFENQFNCSIKIKLDESLSDHIPFGIETISVGNENLEDDSFDENSFLKYKKNNSFLNENKASKDIFFTEKDAHDEENHFSKSKNQIKNQKNKKNKKNDCSENILENEKKTKNNSKNENFDKIHLIYKIWNEWIIE